MPEYILIFQVKGPADIPQDLITDRFPLPRFIVCDAGGSQARFLLSKLNPSTTHTTGAWGGVGAQTAQTIFTDDVSLQTFMDHLMKYVSKGPLLHMANICSGWP
jgi:protein transport protein SEC23